MSYRSFALMIATSTVVMFGLMYVHTYVWDDVYFSETRAWMALLMGAMMTIVMLGFMWSMYPRRTVNVAILAGATATLVLSVWLIRSQVTVNASDYMEAMIPHHSIAVLTSTRAGIDDRRVRKLADEIIEAQRKEMAEMKYLVRVLRRDGVQPGGPPSRPVETLPAGEAARTADLATTDLEPMDEAELRSVLGDAATCGFSYAAGEAPVAVATLPETRPGRGLIKLHGRLVPMAVRYPGPSGQVELSGDDVSVTTHATDAAAADEPREAEALFRIGSDLEVGYAGFFACSS